MLRILQRFLALWTGFGASWDAPGSILEGSGAPGVDFGGSWGSPGRVLEAPGPYFSRFFRPIAALLLQTPHMQKTMVFTGDPRRLANLAFFGKIDSLLRAGYKITRKSLPEFLEPRSAQRSR